MNKPKEKGIDLSDEICRLICENNELKRKLKARDKDVEKAIDKWISKCNLWTTKDIRGSSEVTTEEKWISMVQFNKLKQKLEKIE